MADDTTDPMEILASLGGGDDGSDSASDDSADVGSEAGGSTDVVQPSEAGGTTPDPEDSAVEVEKLYAGKYKTPEDMESAYKEAQAKLNAETQTRQQYEQYLQAIQAQQQAEQEHEEPDAFTNAPSNLKELLEYTYEDPEDAFWFAAQNAPHTLSRVVNEIRQFDPSSADRFILEHSQWQAQTVREQAQQQQEELRQQVDQTRMQAQLPHLQMQAAHAVAQAHSHIAALPNYDDVKGDMALIIRERPHLVNVESESTLALGLRDVYDLALARNGAKVQAANTARANAAGSGGGVEAGSFSADNSAEEEDPVADFKSAIYASANGVKF
jgi:hypothetical protein